jgi:putative endonuclease
MTAWDLWMREKSPAVYILASKRNGTLYVGVTSDFVDRVSLHKQHMIERFSKRYGVDRLVYIEFHADMARAIAREKQLKRWHRGWKIALIEKENPSWRDLYWEMSGMSEV